MTSDCDDCGHCVEMYTPTENDPPQVTAVREAIYKWINGLLGAEAQQTQTFL